MTKTVSDAHQSPITDSKVLEALPWKGGKCRVPMWMGGSPAGYCGRPSNGPQLPMEILFWERAWRKEDRPYCYGPCCPAHGGPKDGEPIIFQDGYTDQGRRMWCAVMPGFENLQESPAGFNGDPFKARDALRAALLSERKE